MPNISILNHPQITKREPLDVATKRICNIITTAHQVKSKNIPINTNPSHITIVYGIIETTLNELTELLSNVDYFAKLPELLEGVLVIAFTGKKSAANQVYFSRNNEFLRKNTVDLVRTGKNIDSIHYNTYKIRQAVQPTQ